MALALIVSPLCPRPAGRVRRVVHLRRAFNRLAVPVVELVCGVLGSHASGRLSGQHLLCALRVRSTVHALPSALERRGVRGCAVAAVSGGSLHSLLTPHALGSLLTRLLQTTPHTGWPLSRGGHGAALIAARVYGSGWR